jgi:hypothetical protein
MIHYVYIDGKIHLQDISRFDFGSSHFKKGCFYRVKSSHTPFNWNKYVLYVSKINKMNDDKIELTFRDPIFECVDSAYTLVRGYVNYDYDDYDDYDEETINIDEFKKDMSPVGWYVITKNNEYMTIDSIEKV